MSLKNKKKLYFILITILLLSLISFIEIIKAETGIANKPEFDIKIESIKPNPALVETDNIIVSGSIIPKDFQLTNLSVQPRDIVFVIDKSTNNSGNDFTPLMQGIGDFISSMHYNDKYKGTRVGVISYDKTAIIHPIRINNEDKFLVDAYEYGNEIKQIFNGNSTIKLNKGGETNTGEALRKAEYLLHGNEANENSNKIIILISDSSPDTITKVNGEFYTNILESDNLNSNFIKTDSSTSIDYANTIAKIVNENRDKVFTLAFNADNKSQEVLKQLHKTMVGYDISENDINENKGFFVTDIENTEKSVRDIFNEIDRQIINSYEISNIKMNINFENNFSLNIGGNIVYIGDIDYKLYSSTEEIENGIFKYRSSPIHFEFNIKADKVGKYEVCNNIDISYIWEEKNIIQNIKLKPALYVEVESNELPNIRVELKEPTEPVEITDENSKEITLKYTIKPQSFTTNDLNFGNKEITEVIFIVDLSNGMKKDYNSRWNALKNSLTNRIISSEAFKSYKFAAIGFNDSTFISDIRNISEKNNLLIKKIDSVENLNLVNPLYSISDNSFKENFRRTFQESSFFESYRSDNEIRNIDNALLLSQKIFNDFGENDKGKAIVLVSTGNITYSEDIVKNIKKEGYRIISIDLSGNNVSNLSELHTKLGGSISSTSTESDLVKFISDSSNNFNNSENDMQIVANRLLSKVQSNIITKITPTFTFDLNDNFQYAEICSSNIKLNAMDNNKLKFTLNTPIEYKYSKTQNENGEYIFTAQEQEIYFNIKVKDGKTGTLEFGQNINDFYSNYFEYTNFENKINKKGIETPIIIIEDNMIATNLKHGLYESVNSISENTEDELKENGDTRFKFYSSSKVKFAISFETTSKSIKGTLNIDDKFNSLDYHNINIYIVESNELEKINLSSENIKSIGNNDFEINIQNINENRENIKILIVYDTIINSANKEFINEFLGSKIKVKSLEEDLNVLPDLF